MLQIRLIPACPYLWGILYLYGINATSLSHFTRQSSRFRPVFSLFFGVDIVDINFPLFSFLIEQGLLRCYISQKE